MKKSLLTFAFAFAFAIAPLLQAKVITLSCNTDKGTPVNLVYDNDYAGTAEAKIISL